MGRDSHFDHWWSMLGIRYCSLPHWQMVPQICLFFISVNAGQVSTWRMMARLVWTSTSAPPLSPAASDASTPMAPTSAYVWMATKPWNAAPICARLCPVSLMLTVTPRSKISKLTFSFETKMFIISAEEPFLIMADHHEIRKLSIDGSNYTILKQVCVTSHNIMPVV